MRRGKTIKQQSIHYCKTDIEIVFYQYLFLLYKKENFIELDNIFSELSMIDRKKLIIILIERDIVLYFEFIKYLIIII